MLTTLIAVALRARQLSFSRRPPSVRDYSEYCVQNFLRFHELISFPLFIQCGSVKQS